MTIIDTAIDYAARGWWLTPLFGDHRTGNDRKKPTLQKWQNQYIDLDRLQREFQRFPRAWLAVLLGASRSGIIDVECDSPEAEESLTELLGDAPLCPPTFAATRGRHRLFLPSADLDRSVRRAKFDFRGIEFRLGCEGLGALSVFPPCGDRRWLVGLDEGELVELPEHVRQLLIVAANPPRERTHDAPIGPTSIDSANLSRFTRDLLASGAPESGWNAALFRAACDMAGCGVPQTEAESSLLAAARPWNHMEERRVIQAVCSAYRQQRVPARPSRVATAPASTRRPQARPRQWGRITVTDREVAYG